MVKFVIQHEYAINTRWKCSARIALCI